jgi:putative restriction endonuclease
LSGSRSYQLAFNSWPLLTAAAESGATITYKQVGDQIGIHHRTIRLALGLIQDYCLDEGLPPLTVVVVSAARQRPGEGFIAWDPVDLDEAYRQVHAYPWRHLANPYAFAASGTTPSQLADRLLQAPSDSAAVYALVRSRGIAQHIFRRALLTAYDRKCAFCGLSIGAALQAAHIIPWGQASPSQRMSPANGLLLCATHHQLFDAHILALTPAYQIACHLSPSRRRTSTDRTAVSDLHGQFISLPSNPAHHPSPQAIEHRIGLHP